MTRETDARIIIDRLLREAGWDIENKSRVSTEEPFKGEPLSLSGLGLIESETVEHEPPEHILEIIAKKQERIANLIGELRTLFDSKNQGE